MPKNQDKERPKWLNKLEKDRHWRLGAVLLLAVSLILAAAVDVWICIGPMRSLWRWGFPIGQPFEWHLLGGYTLAILGCLGLTSVLTTLPTMAISGLWQVVSLYFDETESDFKEKLDSAKQAQLQAEEELEEIEKDDKTGLIQVVKYSRVQLEQYYTIGLRQTQQSFRYSILAMWIGFVMMAAGLLPIVRPFGAQTAGQPVSVNLLVSAGGLVIELISAMFLWMYRSSIGQLTYFYNRQMHLHNVLICFRIAANMKSEEVPQALNAKALIIQKVLDSIWTVERPDAPNERGLKDLLAGTTSKTEPAK
jgi:hypothetical protein